MNVAYISFSKIPSREANSIHVMKMSQAYRQEGHHITLYAPKLAGKPENTDDLWTRYGISTPFDITFVPTGNHPFSMLRDQEYAIRVMRNIRGKDISLVHTRHLYSAMWASLLNIPTIFDMHDPIIGGRLGQLYFRLLLAGKGFRKIAAITQALKSMLPRYLRRGGQVIVAPNGVDIERYDNLPDAVASRRRLGLPPDTFIAGYSGHLYPGRGMNVIFDAARRHSDATFLLIGGADEDIARRKKAVSDAGLENVIFSGFVENTAIPEYLAACDALLMPYQRSVGTADPSMDSASFFSAMKMFEYMAANRLIVSSDLPVLREILDESNAVLCPPDDTEAWCEAIRRARNDPSWAEKLAGKARSDVERYTWRSRVRRILSSIDA
ncbi:MAG: glycosyltransferase family 4 protein [Candidatus Latescibacteria bacterium]|nr:glycosyltransferase family 4 protein [Candidatus Latescibacterota bacterium]